MKKLLFILAIVATVLISCTKEKPTGSPYYPPEIKQSFTDTL